MNIQTAAGYMKYGYRVRRSAWTILEYILQDHGVLWANAKPGGTHMSAPFILDDLLADDWEIITEGIASHFPLKYEDE